MKIIYILKFPFTNRFELFVILFSKWTWHVYLTRMCTRFVFFTVSFLYLRRYLKNKNYFNIFHATNILKKINWIKQLDVLKNSFTFERDMMKLNLKFHFLNNFHISLNIYNLIVIEYVLKRLLFFTFVVLIWTHINLLFNPRRLSYETESLSAQKKKPIEVHWHKSSGIPIAQLKNV